MKYRITSFFGAVEAIRSGHSHNGIDIATPLGTTLRSVVNGSVEEVMDGSTAIGKGVVILAEDGTRHIYGHLSKVSVRVGEKIFKGETLGASGNTGHSTGPHLHYSIHRNGEYQDPSEYIEEVDRLAGVLQTKGIITQLAGEGLREKVKDQAQEIIWGILDAVGEVLKETSMIIAAILVILRAVGFKHPWIRPGVVIALNLILRVILA